MYKKNKKDRLIKPVLINLKEVDHKRLKRAASAKSMTMATFTREALLKTLDENNTKV